MTDSITPAEFHAADGLEGWRVLGEGACAFFPSGSFAAGARLVAAIGELPDLGEHRPDVDLRHDGVTVRILTLTDSYAGMTRADVELARRITELARGQGLVPDPAAVQSFLVVPGAPAPAEVRGFWRAVLGYTPRIDSPEDDLVDPHGRGPSIWFEDMDEPRPGGLGAIHVAVWVPHDQAEARVAAALAAGGRVVRDRFAPAWWTLADAAGNEVDVATVLNRD